MYLKNPHWRAVAASLILLPAGTFADTVLITDGSQIRGEILRVSEGKLEIETEYAGILEVDLAFVDHFSTDESTSVRLEDGNVLVGPINAPSAGTIEIETSGGAVTAATSEVLSVWPAGEPDPDQVAREAALRGQMRHWTYQAAVAIGGRTGNTTRSNIGIDLGATLEGPSDRLEIAASYDYAAEETGPAGQEVRRRSADEAILGMSYTSYFSEKWGWYIREELEYDTFENIEFRSTTGAGISHRVFKRPTHSLELRAGLAYRYESYYDLDLDQDGVVSLAEASQSDDSFPSLDFGLQHYWQFATWGEMNNTLNYTPSIDDFGDYLIDHTSAVDIPLGASDFWKLRLSLNNQYNSQPTGEREGMDTTYALSLLLNWR